MSTFINRATPQGAANYYYRPASYAAAAPPRPAADVRDDYERWYTETVPNNRMSLSLRSGIHSEIAWSLDRLCRLAHNEQFSFNSYPGLIDGLFDWPEWYATEGYKRLTDDQMLFSPPPDFVAQHRYALESLFVLRNGALHDPNARDLATHSHTLPLILSGLNNLDFTRDENQEVLLHIIDIFQVLSPNLVINAAVPDKMNPILPLMRIVSKSSNRSLIVAAFNALNVVLAHPSNTFHLARIPEALDAAIRYLPLFVDKPLLEASLEHIYVHVAHPATARAFLFNKELPSILKVLCSLILSEQHNLEERITIDITGQSQAVPSTTLATRDYQLTKEEHESLLEMPEPQRCYEWMKLMLVQKPDGEMTQVDIWTLYKDAFGASQDKYPLLGASEVIKNISQIYPTGHAMVLQGPVQRFVVRGIDRRKESIVQERFKCQWNRNGCSAQALTSPSELFDHLLEHVGVNQPPSSDFPCLWSRCSRTLPSTQHLRSHLLTHIPTSQPLEKPPSQSETITLSPEYTTFPPSVPTTRKIPPAPKTVITYERPVLDPPSPCLTALLIVRVLFRTAFASTEAAPKADGDHFGFPGIVEEDSDPSAQDIKGEDTESIMEGEKKGRKAFVGIHKMLESIRIRDEALMGWVMEMVDVVVPEV